ncbi:MAG TPA: PAS domain-containing sensor histidine kinase [Saprospiraceae bacterium]|nr:PAS domain-containing sensor histidine kinase [Saprospiraceae bacterium]
MSTEYFKDISNRLNAIIETAVDGIITIDVSGKIENINNSALFLFGYSKDEVMGKNIRMLMPLPHREKHDMYISNYLSSRIPKIIGIGREVEGLKKNGGVFPFWLSVSEVILNDRIIFTGIVHDLTEIKEAEIKVLQLNAELEKKVNERTYELENVINKLLETNKKLEDEIAERKSIENKLKNQEEELRKSLEKEKELGALKSRFVSMASHEFRTPLATILSSASLISRYPSTHQQDNRVKHVERIKKAVNNLTGILNDFLSLSKLEEGGMTLNLESFSLKEVCNEVFSEVESILKENQNLIYNETGDIHFIKNDRRIIKNILFNLITNAIKYSGTGKNIECNVSFLPSFLEIEIKDYGIGIPIEEQKYLFDRFFRASNAINIQGTGLGLNIVKRYLEMIKGEIHFQSLPQKGSSFVIRMSNS